MGFKRGPDGKLEITPCKGYCQENNSDKTCGEGCRNIKCNENKNFNNENDKTKRGKMMVKIFEEIEKILNDNQY